MHFSAAQYQHMKISAARAPIIQVADKPEAARQPTMSAGRSSPDKAQITPGFGPIDISATDRVSYNRRLFDTAKSNASIVIGGQAVQVEWAGAAGKTDNTLHDLRVKDPNSSDIFIANAKHPNIQILKPDGQMYEIIGPQIRGGSSGVGRPEPAEFEQGALVLNGLMRSQDYFAETKGAEQSQFNAITADKNGRTRPLSPPI